MSFWSYSTAPQAIYFACKYGFEKNPMYMNCRECPNNFHCDILHGMETDLEIAANRILREEGKGKREEGKGKREEGSGKREEVNVDYIFDPRFEKYLQAKDKAKVSKEFLLNEKDLPPELRQLCEATYLEFRIGEGLDFGDDPRFEKFLYSEDLAAEGKRLLQTEKNLPPEFRKLLEELYSNSYEGRGKGEEGKEKKTSSEVYEKVQPSKFEKFKKWIRGKG